jgi:hypothetical protein
MFKTISGLELRVLNTDINSAQVLVIWICLARLPAPMPQALAGRDLDIRISDFKYYQQRLVIFSLKLLR